MAAILTRVGVELRTRWLAWLAVALLIGGAGGVVLTTAAGARRTGSAYTRFLHESHASDMLVSPEETGLPGYYRALERETGAQVAPVIGFEAEQVEGGGEPMLIDASSDGRSGISVDRPKITAGRMFEPGKATEVVADVVAARALHLHPGSRLSLVVSGTNEQRPDPGSDPTIAATVVGIGVARDSVVPVNALANAPRLYAGPALTRILGPEYYAFDGANVTRPPGQSKAAFTTAALAVARRFANETGGSVLVADESQQSAEVEHAIRPESVALGLFAALTGLTALFAVGQVVARQVSSASTDNHVLRALGLSRRQLLAVALVEVAVVAVIGAVIAMAIAIAASPTMPIGPARLAEPHPGVSVDWLVLGGGFALIVVLLLLTAAWPAWRAAQVGVSGQANNATARRPSRLTRWATNAGRSPATSIGVGYAVDPGAGRTAVPVRGAIAVTAISVTALAAALTFGANLSQLVHTPHLYGQAWDVTADAQFSQLATPQLDALLEKEPGVTAWTFGVHDDITIAGREVPTVGLSRGHGALLAPTILGGGPAEGPHDIALGARTLEQTGLHVGQTVTVQFQSREADSSAPPPTRMRIVGRSVFPFFGEGSFTPTGLGVGAQVTTSRGTGSGEPQPPNFVLVNVAPGPHHDAQVARVVRDLGRSSLCGPFNQCTVSTTIRPTDILNYSRVQGTPVALAAVLALLAIGVLANLLVNSIRRRRHDFAILKTLGFRRRQVSATVTWQATTLVGIALVIGLPVGTALGLRVWGTFADNLGVPGDPRTPVITLLIAIPAALVIGNVIAAIPGLLAGRLSPATALRTD